MKSTINLALVDIVVRKDFHQHVALMFYRDEKVARYLAFSAGGLQVCVAPIAQFLEQFKTISANSLEHDVSSMLKSVTSAYSPDVSAAPILLEIITMNTKTETLADIVLAYNKLAFTAGRPTIKEFKSKAVGLERIEALKKEIAKPSAAQEAVRVHTAAAAAAGAARKAKIEAPKAKPVPAKPTKPAKVVPAKAAAAKPAAKTEGKKRGLGIGAFCYELLRKGKTNDEILTAVKAKFPDASTSASSVAWYRNKLKEEA